MDNSPPDPSNLLHLVTFPAPLQRVILSGRAHLQACSGLLWNLEDGCNGGFWSWDPVQQRALRPDRTGHQVLTEPARWALPGDWRFPWRDRLGVTAAWMAGITGGGGYADIEFHPPMGGALSDVVALVWWSAAFGERCLGWDVCTGEPVAHLSPATRRTYHQRLCLPTLKRHSATCRIDCALLLSLNDVPECSIRFTETPVSTEAPC